MRTNYVLIDFESVQPESLELLAHEHFRLLVVVGASQSKIPFEIAAAVVVKLQFRNRSGREFRKAFRAAGR